MNVEPIDEKNLDEIKTEAREWHQPLHDLEVTSFFGERGDEFHEGIDFKAARGSQVFAVQSGQVIYSGARIKGYGQLVVLKHPSGLVTIYAHNTKNLVPKGMTVQKGQLIAYSGESGRASGPHLHFEIRRGVVAIDPMSVLPLQKRADVFDRSAVTQNADQ